MRRERAKNPGEKTVQYRRPFSRLHRAATPPNGFTPPPSFHSSYFRCVERKWKFWLYVPQKSAYLPARSTKDHTWVSHTRGYPRAITRSLHHSQLFVFTEKPNCAFRFGELLVDCTPKPDHSLVAFNTAVTTAGRPSTKPADSPAKKKHKMPITKAIVIAKTNFRNCVSVIFSRQL